LMWTESEYPSKR